MKLVEEYRKQAQKCRRMGAKAPSPEREELLRLAEQWILLADERERFVRRMSLPSDV